MTTTLANLLATVEATEGVEQITHIRDTNLTGAVLKNYNLYYKESSNDLMRCAAISIYVTAPGEAGENAEFLNNIPAIIAPAPVLSDFRAAVNTLVDKMAAKPYIKTATLSGIDEDAKTATITTKKFSSGKISHVTYFVKESPDGSLKMFEQW